MIPDEGNFSKINPAKLFLTIYEQARTGILHVTQNEDLKNFYLNRGKISWAFSSAAQDGIEPILLAKKMITAEILARYQEGSLIEESFGKVLVEDGLLSLEQLIAASREQAKLITTSIMRWQTGTFQMVSGPPPTRLVSLELNIPSLVSEYVFSQKDIQAIWDKLEALSGEWQQNFDFRNNNIYAISPEQEEVLSYFSEPQPLKRVLRDFPPTSSNQKLKILDFLLLTSLLVRKDGVAKPSADLTELDSMFGQAFSEEATDVEIQMPDMMNESESKGLPLVEFPDIPILKNGKDDELPDLPDLFPHTSAEPKEENLEIPVFDEAEKPKPSIRPLLKPEKQTRKWLSVPFLSILLATMLIAAFLWLTRTPREAKPAPALATAAKTEPAPVAEKTETTTELPPVGTGPETEPPAAEEEQLVAAAGAVSPLPLFQAGNFRAAGDAWRSEILAAKVTYSILLELDCVKESVRSAYSQLDDKENFFLLNKTSRDDRNCYLVLWGKYRSADEAAMGMKFIPEYFMKQSHPPTVIELQPYVQ